MISVIIPVYNEEESVSSLHAELVSVLKGLGVDYEIIFVNDGSTDETLAALKTLHPVRVISFVQNFGKSAAFAAGFKAARGERVITMDGDLQNNPNDIPRLLAELDKGFDIAAGWRESRWKRSFFTRRLPSWVANWLISRMTGVKLHDHGCALKAYKRSALAHIELTEDMQRMVAVQAALHGGRVSEIKIDFRDRKFGKPKFGMSRFITVILDLLNFYFFKKYARRSSHFFGMIGIWLLIGGFFMFLWALFLKVALGTNFVRTPLPIFTAIAVVVGFQFIFLGLLAEMIARNRNDGDAKASYIIREEIENK